MIHYRLQYLINLIVWGWGFGGESMVGAEYLVVDS